MERKCTVQPLYVILVLFLALGCRTDKKTQIRILAAGIRHESNSFTPYLTTVDDFVLLRDSAIMGSAWAGFLHAEGVEAFWMFQYAFSAASATIVAGTLAERCQMAAYLCYSVMLTGSSERSKKMLNAFQNSSTLTHTFTSP